MTSAARPDPTNPDPAGSDPTSEAFFEALYRSDPDPWNFADDVYERDRFNAIMDAVGPGPFRRVFEPGCSTGELTRMLAKRSRAVVAMDTAPSAVSAARVRCADLGHVDVHHDRLPAMPEGTFDLIVFSEVGYYFTVEALAHVIDRLVERLDVGGRLVACHWTGTSPDHVLAGSLVQHIIAMRSHLEAVSQQVRPGFEMGTWMRVHP